MQHVSSLAGTRLRFASLRSACSPLAHYAPLDREQGAHLRYASFHFAPLVDPPALCLATLRHSHQFRRKVSLPHPPPARARPSTSLRFRSGTCPAGLPAAPRPARGGPVQHKTLKMKQNTCRAPRPGGWGPGPPPPPPPPFRARGRFRLYNFFNK